MLVITSTLLLALAKANIVDDVTYAFESSHEFCNKKSSFDDDSEVEWDDGFNTTIFDQANSGLCSIYAATAVTRQPVSPSRAGRAMCDWFDGVWESPKDIVRQGIPGLHHLEEKRLLDDHVLEQTYFGSEAGMGSDYPQLIAERLIQYKNQKRGFMLDKVFKGFLVASPTPGHTIGITYKHDDGYRVFDSQSNSHKFALDDLRIDVSGMQNNTDDVAAVAAQVMTTWGEDASQHNHFYSTVSMVALFGPLNESPCNSPRSSVTEADAEYDQELIAKLNATNWQAVIDDAEEQCEAMINGETIEEPDSGCLAIAKSCIQQYKTMRRDDSCAGEPVMSWREPLDEKTSGKVYEEMLTRALAKHLPSNSAPCSPTASSEVSSSSSDEQAATLRQKMFEHREKIVRAQHRNRRMRARRKAAKLAQRAQLA